MRAIGYDKNEFKFLEPFQGLFTQGMVCHQTYRNKDGKWLSPEEVILKDKGKFYLKENENEKVIVGPSESMSKSKKHN